MHAVRLQMCHIKCFRFFAMLDAEQVQKQNLPYQQKFGNFVQENSCALPQNRVTPVLSVVQFVWGRLLMLAHQQV